MICAHISLIQGAPLCTIKELARHKSISQTERYSHLCPDQKQDAEKQIVRFFKKTITRTAEIVIWRLPGTDNQSLSGGFKMAHAQLLEQINRLDPAEKSTLVEDIWDSIASQGGSLPLSAKQKDELDRRLAAYEANPDSGSPWLEVKARIVRQ